MLRINERRNKAYGPKSPDQSKTDGPIKRRIVDKELRDSRERLKLLFEYAPAAYTIIDASGNLLEMNRAAEKLLGYSREEQIGKNIMQLPIIPEREIAKLISIIERNVRGEPTGPEVLTLITKAGREIIVESSAYPTKIQGEFVILVMQHDVTRRILVNRLAESEQRFKTIFDNSTDGIIVSDLETRQIFTANRSMCQMIGYTLEELKRLRITDIHPKKALPYVLAAVQRQARGEFSPVGNALFKRKDGTVFYSEVNPFVFSFNGRKYLTGTFRDITSRVKAEAELKEKSGKLIAAITSTVEAVARTTEMRDPYTAGHQRRVAMLAEAIADSLRLSENQKKGITLAAIIHDIGKINVPAEILSKPGKLTEAEFNLIKNHPQAGYDALKGIDFSWPIGDAVLQHHERMNGSGYPQGLRGDSIILEARILAVADVVEAMSSHRPYRPALGIDLALEEIINNRGSLYDSKVVDACVTLFKQKLFKFESNSIPVGLTTI